MKTYKWEYSDQYNCKGYLWGTESEVIHKIDEMRKSGIEIRQVEKIEVVPDNDKGYEIPF